MKYLTFLITGLLLITILPGASYAEKETHVSITYVSGGAEYLKTGQASWQKARVGIFLSSGDSVKTQESGTVQLAFDRNKENIVSVRPGSHVTVLLAGQEKIELINGEVFALVKALTPGSGFEVRTPTAVCGARGTGWGAKTNGQETQINGYENQSYAKGVAKGGSFLGEIKIPEGFGALIGLSGKPSKLMKLTDKDYKAWRAWKAWLLGKGSPMPRKIEKLTKDIQKIQEQKDRIEDRRDIERREKRSESSGAGSGDDRTGNSKTHLE